MCPNSTYWEADLGIDQTKTLTVKIYPFKKWCFQGSDLNLMAGETFGEWLNLPMQELPKIIFLLSIKKGKIARVRVSFFKVCPDPVNTLSNRQLHNSDL